jgi:hypothetical protein
VTRPPQDQQSSVHASGFCGDWIGRWVRTSRWWPLVAIAVLTVAGSGCVTGSRWVPGSDELAEVQRGEKVLVLLRVESEADVPIRSYDAHFSIASIDRDEPVRRVLETDPRMFQRLHPFGREGWTAQVLEPGTYFLAIQCDPAARIAISDGMPAEKRSGKFWLEVPRGSPVVYAGSLKWRFRLRAKGDWLESRPASWAMDDVVLVFDAAGAGRVAAELLGQQTAVRIQPIRFGANGGSGKDWRAAPVSYRAAAPVSGFRQPDWVSRGREQWAGLPQWMDGSDPGLGILLLPVWMGVRGGIGAIQGSQQAHAVADFGREFGDAIRKLPLAETLVQDLRGQDAVSADAANAAGIVCEVKIVRVEWVECSPDRLCLEIAVCCDWRRADTGELVMQRVVCSSDSPYHRTTGPAYDSYAVRPYETLVSASRRHEVAEFSAPGAGRKLAAEIPEILQAIATAAKAEWRGGE